MYIQIIILMWCTVTSGFFVIKEQPLNGSAQYICVTNSSFPISWIDGKHEETHQKASVFIPKTEYNNVFWSLSNTKHWSSEKSLHGNINEIILDRRWENFQVERTLEVTIRKELMFLPVLKELKQNFLIPLSIKAEHAHVFLCDGAKIEKSNCYWFLLQVPTDYSEIKTAIWKCKAGNIALFKKDKIKFPCKKNLQEKLHSLNFPTYLTPQRWSHLILKKNKNILSLLQANEKGQKVILKFAETKNRINVTHMFIHHQRYPGDKLLNGLWKIHQLEYMYTSQTMEKVPIGPIINVSNSLICISMFVSMCSSCELVLTISPKDDVYQVLVEKVYNQKVMYVYSKWAEIKLHQNNIKSNQVILLISTINKNQTGGFWAIDNIRQCQTDEFRMIRSHENVACQLVSYEENIIQFREKSKVKHNCPANTISQYCVPSSWFSDNGNCTQLSVFEEVCPEGRYGADCTHVCSNCRDVCDKFDGTCRSCRDSFWGPKCAIPPLKFSLQITNVSYTTVTIKLITNFDKEVASILNDQVYIIQYKRIGSDHHFNWKLVGDDYRLKETHLITIDNLTPNTYYFIKSTIVISNQTLIDNFKTKTCELTDQDVDIRFLQTKVTIYFKGTVAACAFNIYEITLHPPGNASYQDNYIISYENLTPATRYTINFRLDSSRQIKKYFNTAQNISDDLEAPHYDHNDTDLIYNYMIKSNKNQPENITNFITPPSNNTVEGESNVTSSTGSITFAIIFLLLIIGIFFFFGVVFIIRRRKCLKSHNENQSRKSQNQDVEIPLTSYLICFSESQNQDVEIPLTCYQEENRIIDSKPIEKDTFQKCGNEVIKIDTLKRQYKIIEDIILNKPLYQEPTNVLCYDYVDIQFNDSTFKKAYIITNLPRNDVGELWNTIWKENVQNIIMLDNVHCLKGSEIYWNDDKNKNIQFKDISIQLFYREYFGNYEHRKFIVVKENKTRHVDQLRFTSWFPDNVFLNYLDLVPFLRRMSNIPLSVESPIMVHGRNGIRRTGFALLCDICLRTTNKESVFDVLEISRKLLEDNNITIDNLEQYIMVHLVIYEILFGVETAINCSSGHRRFINKYNEVEIQKQISYLNKCRWLDQITRAIRTRREEDIDFRINASDQLIVSIPNKNKENKSISSIYASKLIEIDDLTNRRNFFVTEQPTSSNLKYFWKLVLKENISVIISLNKIAISLQDYLLQKETCSPQTCKFCPSKRSPRIRPSKHITVEYEDEKSFESHKWLTVRLNKGMKTYQVEIMLVKDWPPSESCPPNLFAFIKFCRESQQIFTGSNQVLLTCCDGVKASGLYLTLMYNINKIIRENISDVCTAVRIFRQHCPDFINDEQYKFLCEAALALIEEISAYEL